MLVFWSGLLLIWVVDAVNLKDVARLTSVGTANLLRSLPPRTSVCRSIGARPLADKYSINHAVFPHNPSTEIIKDITTLPPVERNQVKEYVSQCLSASKFFEHVLEKHCSCRGPGLISKVHDLQRKKELTDPTVQFLHTVHIGTLRNNILHKPSPWLVQRIHRDMKGFGQHFDDATCEIVSVCSDHQVDDISMLQRSFEQSHSDDLLAAIEISRSLHYILVSRYLAYGHTLQRAIRDFLKKYPQARKNNQLKQDLYFLAQERNKLLHDVHQTRLEENYVDVYSRVLEALQHIHPRFTHNGFNGSPTSELE